jgi:hypothetical protein
VELVQLAILLAFLDCAVPSFPFVDVEMAHSGAYFLFSPKRQRRLVWMWLLLVLKRI